MKAFEMKATRDQAADTATSLSAEWLVAAASAANVDASTVRRVDFTVGTLGLEVTLELAPARAGDRPSTVSVLARDVEYAFRALR